MWFSPTERSVRPERVRVRFEPIRGEKVEPLVLCAPDGSLWLTTSNHPRQPREGDDRVLRFPLTVSDAYLMESH